MADFEGLSNAVLVGELDKVLELTKQAIDEKIEVNSIINEGLLPGMNVVGKRFKNGDMYIPEVLISARALNGGMELLKPLLDAGEETIKETVILGTVKGDLHDIGKNLVGMMVESAGYKVVDVGVDIEPKVFIEKIKETGAKVLAMSALLTTTMLAMKDTIETLKEEGLRDRVKVIIGGAPISQDFADEIEADGFAPDAASAAELVKKCLS